MILSIIYFTNNYVILAIVAGTQNCNAINVSNYILLVLFDKNYWLVATSVVHSYLCMEAIHSLFMQLCFHPYTYRPQQNLVGRTRTHIGSIYVSRKHHIGIAVNTETCRSIMCFETNPDAHKILYIVR